MSLRQFLAALPLLLLLAFTLTMSLGFWGNGKDTSPRASLIGQRTPDFFIPLLSDTTKRFSNANFKGQTVVLNAFASDCNACKDEHAVLMHLAQLRKVAIYGIAYKDKKEPLLQWLNTSGNPYQLIAYDEKGAYSRPLHIFATPETLVIGKDGIIYFHTTDPLTDEIVNKEILPLVEQLNAKKP